MEKLFNSPPMRNALVVLLGFWLVAVANSATAHGLTLVELFTSQGCSSCAKSSEITEKLSKQPGVLVLTFGVDYWDYLGWPDTFAKPEFTDRQRAYMKPLALNDVYTPQIIVDGRLQAAAVHAEAVNELIKQASLPDRHAPKITIAAHKITVGRARRLKSAAVAWLVRYEPNQQTVMVKAGENRGKTIIEYNVVRELIRLGAWSGRARTFHVDAAGSDSLKSVVILQAAHGGRVLEVSQD